MQTAPGVGEDVLRFGQLLFRTGVSDLHHRGTHLESKIAQRRQPIVTVAIEMLPRRSGVAFLDLGPSGIGQVVDLLGIAVLGLDQALVGELPETA